VLVLRQGFPPEAAVDVLADKDPLAERHLRKHDEIRNRAAHIRHQGLPGGLLAGCLIGKIADGYLHRGHSEREIAD